MQPSFRSIILATGLLAITSAFAQTPSKPTITRVMATLTVNDGVARDQIQKIMPSEVRDTVQLYLDGRIEQWYARGDGKGVIFILDCKTADEAKALTDTLPLVKAKLVTFEYMPIGPLAPLRYLMGK